MPDLSALLANKRWVDTEFNDIPFKVAYRPGNMSLIAQAELEAKMALLQDDKELTSVQKMQKLGEIFCEVVCDWDWTNEGKPLPINVEMVTRILPGAAIISALNAVTNDGSNSGEKKASSATLDAGLPTMDKLAVAQNGIPSSEQRGTWA
jgi:hypothetical protein